MTTLSTIGYEGASLDDFLATLGVAGVEQVIDIQDVPASRRPGFSKNALMRVLEYEGISYMHLKPLGDPKLGREAAREGRFVAFEAIYREHLARPEGQEALRAAVIAANSAPSALLCYERSFEHCHRTLVANAMAALSCFCIRNLGVQKKSRPSDAGRASVGSSIGAVSVASASGYGTSQSIASSRG